MVRALPMRFFFVLGFVLFAAGCKSNCRQLSEKLCDCAINSVDKDNCLRTASAAEGSNPSNSTDETVCAALLKPVDGGVGCDCRLIDTREGKIRCGLARSGEASAVSGDGGI